MFVVVRCDICCRLRGFGLNHLSLPTSLARWMSERWAGWVGDTVSGGSLEQRALTDDPFVGFVFCGMLCGRRNMSSPRDLLPPVVSHCNGWVLLAFPVSGDVVDMHALAE